MHDSKTPETRRAFPTTSDAARDGDSLCFAAFAFYPDVRGGLKWKSAILLTNSRTTPKTVASCRTLPMRAKIRHTLHYSQPIEAKGDRPRNI